ncbi:MAG: TIR domain-containing protein [Fimbriimonadales bacterium]
MKRVFLSFIAEDKDHANGVRLLASNPNNALEFYDESVSVPYNSTEAHYIKSRIRDKIRRSSVTVCLISENTHRSEWVDWELDESDSLGNTIIAMAVKGVERAVLPKLIKRKGLTFYPWDTNNLAKLINEA